MVDKCVKFIDLFAGVGGFHEGIRRASEGLARDGQKSVRVSKRQEKEHGSGNNRAQDQRSNGRAGDGAHTKSVCVYSNEWDKHAAEVYKKHFGHCDTTDITKVRAEDIPKHDLICAGFPCQAFSIAGKRRGFEETRGTLFFDILRIARHHRTPHLLLENVKGLLNHDGGKTFHTILRSLDELGYDCQWQVLNSKDFGVPQNRERVFIVGHLRGKPRPEVFPIGETGESGIRPDTTEEEMVAGTLTARQFANWGGNHIKVKEATKKGYAEAKEGDSVNLAQPDSATRRGRVGKGVANTLETRAQQAVVIGSTQKHASRMVDQSTSLTEAMGQGGGHVPMLAKPQSKIRRLTPVECERLQGFPDGWTEGRSDTQRYKQMGNAVTVNVVEAVARRLLPCL